MSVDPEEQLERELDIGFIKHSRKDKPRPKLISAADIEPLPVYWTWHPYVPQGMLTMISGDPGLGKSWMTMSIAAAMSTGSALPSGRALPPRKVLIMNYEDSPQHTLVPRLMSLDANLSNIVFPDRFFPLDAEGIGLMREWMTEVAAGVVFIDPLVAALPSGTDMNKANEVRAVMSALAELADRSGASIIAVRHLRKAGKEGRGKDIYAGLGSIDFTASVRSELLVEKVKSGDKVVRHIKCNVGPLGPALHYHFSTYNTTDRHGEPVESSRFEWLGLYEGVDASYVQAPRRAASQDWIRSFLSSGPMLASALFNAASDAGFSRDAIKKAKKGIARSFKQGDFWYWELCPSEGCKEEELDPAVLAAAQAKMKKEQK